MFLGKLFIKCFFRKLYKSKFCYTIFFFFRIVKNKFCRIFIFVKKNTSYIKSVSHNQHQIDLQVDIDRVESRVGGFKY